jgi:protein transport protein SEC20
LTDEGTQIMAKTSSEYKLYNSVIRTSKELINGIASRDWTDRLLILFGFLVFLLTVIYGTCSTHVDC